MPRTSKVRDYHASMYMQNGTSNRTAIHKASQMFEKDNNIRLEPHAELHFKNKPTAAAPSHNCRSCKVSEEIE